MCRSVRSGEVLDEIPSGLQTSEVCSGAFPMIRQPSEGVMDISSGYSKHLTKRDGNDTVHRHLILVSSLWFQKHNSN